MRFKRQEKVRKEFRKAMGSGRWILMLTYVDSNGVLHNYQETREFPRGDIIPSLDFFRKELGKEAALPSRKSSVTEGDGETV